MRTLKFIATAAAGLSTMLALSSAALAADPRGIWLDDTGRGAVEIKPCSDTGDKLCGNVVWVKSTGDTDGCGKQIMGDVTPVGGGRWDNGWIWSPEKGRKYDVELTPLSNGNLKVLGYAGLKFLSKTMIWTPAPADLQLCTSGAPGSKPDSASALPVTPNVDTSAAPRGHDTEAAVTKTPPAADKPASPTNQAAVPATPDAQAKSPPAEAAAKAEAAPEANGSSDGNKGADGLGDLSKMKIGDTQLDKVFTHTGNGKCKLDLPWVKVTIDCKDKD